MLNLDLRDIPALYINLKEDIEKNDHMHNMLNDLGFKNIIRIEASQFRDRHLAGCSLSHFNALNEIEAPFIIFEDDCRVKTFNHLITIPDDADAVYLGISSWGRMNSHSGPCVQFERVDKNLIRVYNMLGAHAILYLSKEYISMCSKISIHSAHISEHQDIGFAEIQRYFNVYAFNDPLFYQTSSTGTNEKLSDYSSIEILQPVKQFWKPTSLYT